MVYAVVIFPENLVKIESIRKVYDNRYDWIRAHITLVFPFCDEKITKEELASHVKSVCGAIKSFRVKTRDSHISFDNAWLLEISTSRKKIIQLHDLLYGDILSEYLNPHIKYIPHITLGVFKDGLEANKVRNKNATVLEDTVVDHVTILQINNANQIVWRKEVSFQ